MNKYLTKLSSLSNIKSFVTKKITDAVGIGKQNYLANTLKISDPIRLNAYLDKASPFSINKDLVKAHMSSGLSRSKAIEKVKSDLKTLHEQKWDGRIAVASGLVGAKILKDNLVGNTNISPRNDYNGYY